MKHVKILGLAALAAAALAALLGAGGASATVLCSTTVEPCPAGQAWPTNTVLDFSVPSGGSIAWQDTNGNSIDGCSSSTQEWKISNAGSSTSTVTGSLSEPVSSTGTAWSGCTFPTQTLSSSGKLEIHKIAGSSNGTVTSDSKVEWTINSVVVGSCVWGYEAGTSLGTITEGKPATLDLNAVVKRFGTNFACPSTERLVATYLLTAPSNTTLSLSSS
jgi:hypothetical protein